MDTDVIKETLLSLDTQIATKGLVNKKQVLATEEHLGISIFNKKTINYLTVLDSTSEVEQVRKEIASYLKSIDTSINTRYDYSDLLASSHNLFNTIDSMLKVLCRIEESGLVNIEVLNSNNYSLYYDTNGKLCNYFQSDVYKTINSMDYVLGILEAKYSKDTELVNRDIEILEKLHNKLNRVCENNGDLCLYLLYFLKHFNKYTEGISKKLWYSSDADIALTFKDTVDVLYMACEEIKEQYTNLTFEDITNTIYEYARTTDKSPITMYSVLYKIKHRLHTLYSIRTTADFNITDTTELTNKLIYINNAFKVDTHDMLVFEIVEFICSKDSRNKTYG